MAKNSVSHKNEGVATMHFSPRRINSGSAVGWSALSRGELEERFTIAVNMLRKMSSGRIEWDVAECRRVLENVVS